MDTILALLMFCVLAAMLWDIRRSQARSQASLERITEITAEVLRRTPQP